MDCKLDLQWPYGYTWDGFHALPKLATEFWKVLLNLDEGMVDPNYIIQRHFLLKKKLDKVGLKGLFIGFGSSFMHVLWRLRIFLIYRLIF